MNSVTTTSTLSKSRVDVSFFGRALFAVLFAVLLPVALIAAATGWRWQPWSPGVQGYRNFLVEAKIAARIATETALSL
ncbi:MAG: hypothetical protein AAF465_02630 [Pseudomonadota bacterium]